MELLHQTVVSPVEPEKDAVHTTLHRAGRTWGDAGRSRRRALTCCECWVQQRPSLHSASSACGQPTLHTTAWLNSRADVGSRVGRAPNARLGAQVTQVTWAT